MPRILTFFLLMLFSLTAFAGDTKVAILEFQGSLPRAPFKPSPSLCVAVHSISFRSEFSLMEREMLVIMADMGLDASCIGGSCEVELARKYRADYVIPGKVMRRSNLLCTVKVHETKSGKAPRSKPNHQSERQRPA